MGKKPAEIQREIAEHRDRMSAKMEHLQDRIQSDAQGVRDRMGERTPGTDAMSHWSERVSEHPLSYMAGGFGVGTALGMFGPGVRTMVPRRGNGQSQEVRGDGDRQQQSRNGSSGGGMMGMLSGTVMSAVEDAVRPLVRDAVAGFKGDERRPESRDQEKEKQEETADS